MPTISLPTKHRRLEPYTTGEPIVLPKKGDPPKFNRVAYAATHVVADPLADIDPWLDAAIDWESTIAFRHYLWDLGLGVAEAMDTAQRGTGLDWSGAKELIRRALEAARSRSGALISCGVGTDHLQATHDVTIDDVIHAYEEQIEAIETMGGRVILMASRALARAAKGPDDYVKVYDRILKQVRRAGNLALARRDVRSSIEWLLGRPRSHRRDGNLPRHHQRPCRQGRRRQDIAFVEG